MAVTLEQIALKPGQLFRLLSWTDNVTDVELCLYDGDSEKFLGAGEHWHFHPEYELTLITTGHGKRFVGDHVANFAAPDLVLIGPNLPHCWSELHESSGFAIQFVLDADHPLGQLDELRSLDAIRREAVFGLQFSGPVVKQIECLMKEMASNSSLHALSGFLATLASLTSLDEKSRTQLSSTKFALNEHDPHMAAISRAVGFVLANSNKNIAVDDLLEVTHMSKPTFSRQFKRHTGRSFVAFLNEVRIANARRLLIETNHSVTDIAFESGYSNLSHFNLQFRRSSGESPREYRKRAAIEVKKAENLRR